MALVTDNTKKTCINYWAKPLPFQDIRALIIHRVDLNTKAPGNPNPIVDEKLNGEELCRRFRASSVLGTMRRIPYHCLIRYPNGEIEQILPLSLRGAHCIGWNYRSIGIAVVGDCDKRPPTDAQYDSLARACKSLAIINYGLNILGHTDIPGGSSDPNKRCPGRCLNVDELEKLVSSLLPSGWSQWSKEKVLKCVIADGWRL